MQECASWTSDRLLHHLCRWELAQLAEMSPHYFCELFKASTGTTAYQYILRARMDRAKQYLRDPKMTVAGAGSAVGFDDQSHFAKVFRRMVGVTPMNYRAGVQ